MLKWHGIWNCSETFEHTVRWYRDFFEQGTASSEKDLDAYMKEAKEKGLEWTK
jgi:CDP-glucose 4,6-dehydratase